MQKKSLHVNFSLIGNMCGSDGILISGNFHFTLSGTVAFAKFRISIHAFTSLGRWLIWIAMFALFLIFIYLTLLREQDQAHINSLRWSTLVGLKPVYSRMWVARSTTVLLMPLSCGTHFYTISTFNGWNFPSLTSVMHSCSMLLLQMDPVHTLKLHIHIEVLCEHLNLALKWHIL